MSSEISLDHPTTSTATAERGLDDASEIYSNIMHTYVLRDHCSVPETDAMRPLCPVGAVVSVTMWNVSRVASVTQPQAQH